jgi:diaminopimelate decarboxylase
MTGIPTGTRVVTWLRESGPPVTVTPTSFVDLDRVAESVALVRRSSPRVTVAYAVKASYLRPVVEVVREAGGGVSVFSPMELFLARRAGFAPGDIVYNGVGRDGRSLCRAVREGVQVNIESLTELRCLLDALASDALAPDALGSDAVGSGARGPDARPAAIGLRVNAVGSAVEGGTDKYGFLGLAANDLFTAADLLAGTGLGIRAVSFHRSANQLDAGGHLAFLDALLPALRKLCDHPSVALDHVNVGGGFASRSEVGDDAALAAFRAIADRVDQELDVATVFELGRFLVADAEAVVSRVVDVREDQDGGPVAILDATTNYLVPAPGHRFGVERLSPRAGQEPGAEVRFVDRLGSEICRNECAPLAPGTLVCVVNAGAYAGVLKERFVYPLPETRFVRHGRVVASAPAGDEHDVLDYHHWWPATNESGTGAR